MMKKIMRSFFFGFAGIVGGPLGRLILYHINVKTCICIYIFSKLHLLFFMQVKRPHGQAIFFSRSRFVILIYFLEIAFVCLDWN